MDQARGAGKDFSDKQKHILEIGERLFATKGFDGTSVRDIAQEAGVNVAMISYYFGSKEKLLEAVFDMRVQQIQARLLDMVRDDSLSPQKKIDRLIEQSAARMFSNQHFYKLMVREQISIGNSPIVRIIHETKKQNHEFIKTIIMEGQAMGVFRQQVDIPLLLVTMFGTINHFISTQHHYKDIHNLNDMPEDDFRHYMQQKIVTHLKTIFQAILSPENK